MRHLEFISGSYEILNQVQDNVCWMAITHVATVASFPKYSRVMEKDQSTYLIKKLIYKSSKRGCKEMDILLGNFAINYLNGLKDEELVAFDVILNQLDADIIDWINGSAEVPSFINSNLIKQISKMGNL